MTREDLDNLATANALVTQGASVFISNLGDLDRLFAQIKREKGRLDIVFANAGIAKYGRFVLKVSSGSPRRGGSRTPDNS